MWIPLGRPSSVLHLPGPSPSAPSASVSRGEPSGMCAKCLAFLGPEGQLCGDCSGPPCGPLVLVGK